MGFNNKTTKFLKNQIRKKKQDFIENKSKIDSTYKIIRINKKQDYKKIIKQKFIR